MADTNNHATVLGPGAVFKGQLEVEKEVRLLGTFEGKIDCRSRVVIENGGTLAGDAEAENIQVKGRVKGNLVASQRVELTASARVEADLQTTQLEIAEGAILVGKCMIGVKDRAGQAGAGASSGRNDAGKGKGKGAPSQSGGK